MQKRRMSIDPRDIIRINIKIIELINDSHNSLISFHKKPDAHTAQDMKFLESFMDFINTIKREL